MTFATSCGLQKQTASLQTLKTEIELMVRQVIPLWNNWLAKMRLGF